MDIYIWYIHLPKTDINPMIVSIFMCILFEVFIVFLFFYFHTFFPI